MFNHGRVLSDGTPDLPGLFSESLAPVQIRAGYDNGRSARPPRSSRECSIFIFAGLGRASANDIGSVTDAPLVSVRTDMGS